MANDNASVGLWASIKRWWFDAWPKFVLYVGLIGLLALPVGALGTRFGIWPVDKGFNVLFGGALLAVIALVLGIAGWIRALLRGRAGDKPYMAVGVVASVFVLAWMGLQFRVANDVPPIHNISTDRIDPPAFNVVVGLRGTGANPLDYDEEDARAQAAGYPDLAGIEVAHSVEASLERAAAVARELGWEVVHEGEAGADGGIVEATDTTFWFGFKDDVVVRVRPTTDGSKVDLRSVSRVGQSDLGANAARIEAFLDAFGSG